MPRSCHPDLRNVTRLLAVAASAGIALLAPSPSLAAGAGLGATVSAGAGALGATAMAALMASGLAAHEFGLMVRPLNGSGLQFAHNAEVAFNPASTMKLVTTHAAIGVLGADYRWVTTFYVTAPIKNGVLEGDLIIKGGGDPKLVKEDMAQLVRELRARGLRDLRGDLVIDDALYQSNWVKEPTIDGRVERAYNVAPFAALMNFNVTELVIDPFARAIATDPTLADVRIDNQVRVLRGRRCRRTVNDEGEAFSITTLGTENYPVVRVSGALVRICGERTVSVASLSHRQFIHGFFKAAWLAAGGTMSGVTRVATGAAEAVEGRTYYQWISPRTLTDVVHDINKHSNNVMARMLLLQMAAVPAGEPASVKRGEVVLRNWYAVRKLRLRSLVLENGSGLSRNERISVADLSAVLLDAASGADGLVFQGSLPEIGIDGTMRDRMRGDALVGRAQIKSGTLRDVSAIAGYLTADSGTRYVVALIVNSPAAADSLSAQDGILRWLFENG